MRFAREGHPFMLAAWIATAAAWFLARPSGIWGWSIVAAFALLALFVTYFFRDPHRTDPEEATAVVSPADGKIIDIIEVEETTYIEGACRRITIFLSVFNVHVQRAPISGEVDHRAYFPGGYAVAWHPKASEENERASVGLRVSGSHVMVTQIAGLIARRIVTYPQVGDSLHRGDRIGLIRFGSRVDLFVPLHWPLSCRVGDIVRGGESILAAVATLDAGSDDGTPEDAPDASEVI